MGRPKGSVNKKDEGSTVEEVSETPLQIDEDVVTVDESEIKEEQNRILELEKELRKTKEELKKTKETAVIRPLKEMLKQNTFGTRSYLKINILQGVDGNGKKFVNCAMLSAFPDLIESKTGEYLAPDVGFDGPSGEVPYYGRAQAERWRTGDLSTTKIVFDGKETTIAEAIKILQEQYYNKRIEGDKRFLEEQKLLRD